MTAPSVSVVIPAHNAARTLPVLMSALRRQTAHVLEIVVVDDGSDDDTAAVGEALRATVVRLDRNYGPGLARNAGVARTRGDIIAFTDADCVPPPGWIERSLEFMAAHEARLTTSGYLGPVGTDLSSWFQHWEKRAREPFAPQKINATNGHSLVVERSLYEEEGGMADIRTSEDFLFGLGVSRTTGVYFDPDNGVFHHFRQGAAGFFRQKMLFAQNSLRCTHTVPLKLTQVATFSPLRVLLDLALTAAGLALLAAAAAAGLGARSLALAAVALALLGVRITPFLVFLWRRRRTAAATALTPEREEVPPLLFCYSPPHLILRDVAFIVGLLRGYAMLLFGEPVRLNPRRNA